MITDLNKTAQKILKIIRSVSVNSLNWKTVLSQLTCARLEYVKLHIKRCSQKDCVCLCLRKRN